MTVECLLVAIRAAEKESQFHLPLLGGEAREELYKALNQHLCHQGQSSVVMVREGNHDK